MSALSTPLQGETGMEVSGQSPSVNGLPPYVVLLAETDSKVLNNLPQALTTTYPDLSVDVCSSRDHALAKLATGSYHAIIANAHLAVMDDQFLLRYQQTVQPYVPFLVSTEASERALAEQALKSGALNLLVQPIDAEQIQNTIRPALWLFQIRLTIHRRQEHARKLRERLTISSISSAHRKGIEQNLRDVEDVYSSCLRAVDQIESSLRYLQETAADLEREAHERGHRALGLLR